MLLTLLLQRLLAQWATGSAKDFTALAVATFVLATVALIAGGVPARRAARIEPMEALRYE